MLSVTIHDSGFEMVGHAEYAERGQDILCSACTSAMYLTIETLKKFAPVKEFIRQGDVEVFVEENEHVKAVLESFQIYMKRIEAQFPTHLSVIGGIEE